MKMEITTTTMRIIEVIIETIDPIGASITVEGHIEGPSKGEGDNKIIIKANFKVGSLIFLMVAIIIITVVIIMAEVAVAVVTEETIIEAIIIIHANNITCMMMGPSLINMDCHALFVGVSITLLNIALRENMTSTISW